MNDHVYDLAIFVLRKVCNGKWPDERNYFLWPPALPPVCFYSLRPFPSFTTSCRHSLSSLMIVYSGQPLVPSLWPNDLPSRSMVTDRSCQPSDSVSLRASGHDNLGSLQCWTLSHSVSSVRCSNEWNSFSWIDYHYWELSKVSFYECTLTA